LLEKIRDEKQKLIEAGKIKPDKNESIIYKDTSDNSYYELRNGKVLCIDEIPFEIPDNWAWCRLNELALYRKGPFGSSLTKSMFVPKSENSIKVYEQKNAIQKDYKLGDYYISKDKFEVMQSFIVCPNDIIVSCAGTIGETYVLPNDAPIGIINQALMRVCLYYQDICPFWLLYFDYILKQQTRLKSAGSAIKNIPPFEILKNMLMPIPPIAEQQRIVKQLEIIEQLFAQFS
jgi:type I restriction enzyme S subunit